jgi:glycogen debranching enzyme
MFLLLLPVSIMAQEGMIPGFPIERDETTLERLAQPNTYFDKAGRKFAILGTESGVFEAWAYPLKLLRNFELSFLLKNSSRPIPAGDIVRFIEMTPAATTLTYTYQSFTVKATYITAIEEPGAVILLAVDATEPLTIVAGFLPVLQPMWPAGIGGQYAYWDGKLKAYLISEPTRSNHGYVGSPAAQGISYTPAHMLSDMPNEFMIVVDKPQAVKSQFIPIILAGGKGKREDIKKVYENLASDPQAVYQAALSHYRDLRRNTLRVRTPVRTLNLALEWAKVSFDNLLVDNPDLGRGLVAGIGLSGTGGRPGFGWFFGTDAYLNSLSLCSLGALDKAREALEFTQKWQREDGKMAHELSQAAGYIDWFKNYPYGYIHGDTTPYYIAAFYDYFSSSGDREFLKQSWPSLQRAYEWCLTTDGNGDGLMDNAKAGLGALEFGSLTGIETDIYLAAVWTRAAFGMAELARALGDEKLAARAAADHEKALKALEAKFWDAEAGQYSYAFNKDGKLVKELTPWCAVPLMWHIGSAERAAQTLEKMSSADLATDWGIRILSSRSSLYEPLNYNYGAVWPFLTGYVAAAHYENDNCLQAYGLMAANAGHFFDNALGHVTELFSGALYVWPQEAVAHQGFSATGFILPFVRGLLGLEADAAAKRVDFEPNFPADWSEVEVENFKIGQEAVSLKYGRSETEVRLEIGSRPGASLKMTFAPSFGLGVRVRDVRLNGLPLQFEALPPRALVRPVIKLSLSGQDVVEVKFDPAVEILPPKVESRVGDFDTGLKIIRQELDGRSLKLVVEGLAGRDYTLGLINANLVAEVSGGEVAEGRLLIHIPGSEAGRFARHEIIIRMK